METAEFEASQASDAPPASLTPPLCALWWEAKGDWSRGHALIAADEGRSAAWVHAYLHRREGDQANALYWYRRAGQPASTASLDGEREAIVTALLAYGTRAA